MQLCEKVVVPDLTTAVLILTITGLAADSWLAGTNPWWHRRTASKNKFEGRML